MASENSIITLLQPPAPVENPVASQTKKSGEEGQFQNMLEEASRNVKPSEDSASTRNDGQGDQTLANQRQKTDQASRNNGSDQKAGDNQPVNGKETFESELTSANQEANPTALENQNLVQEKANSLVDSQDALVESLKSLGIDQEQIDAFLHLLQVDTSDAAAEDLILSLAGQFNPQQTEELKNSLTKFQGVEGLASLTDRRDRLAADLLRQAGMSDAEAKNFLQKIFQAKVNALNPQDSLAQNVKLAEGESIAKQVAGEIIAKQTATTTQSLGETAQAGHAQAREAGGELTAELINKQRLEAQKLNIKEQVAETRDAASSERIKSQDPLDKVLNSASTRQPSSSENAPQTTLLNSLGLRNAQDNFTPLEQGAAKISVESLAQNSYQSVEKLSGQTEALKQAAKEAPLPRGVTESKVIDQIVKKFSVRGSAAKNEVHIRLEPPSLGTVRMNISTSGDVMKTTVIAENHAVRQAIESNLSQLKDSLSEQGLTVESFDVLVGGDPGFKGQNQQQSGNGRSQGFAANDRLNEEAQGLAHLDNAPPVFLGDGKISIFA